jgi:predicted ATPase
MSIQALRLRNFRGYRDVTLKLAPLTVLLGPNSSGKSSFSHPLAALAHCQKLYSGTRNATLTPENPEKADQWPIDLGGYDDLATKGSRDKIRIDLWTSEGWVEFGFGLVPTAPDLLWFSHVAYPRDVNVSGSSLSTTQLSGVPSGPPILAPSDNSTVDVGPGSNRSLQPVEDTNLVLERINEQGWQHRGNDASLGLDGLIPLNLRHSSGTEIILNRKSSNEIRSLLQHLAYLRASRKRPTRGYPRFRSEQKSIGYAGENTASVLLNRGLREENLICPPLPISTASEKNLLAGWQERTTTLQDSVSQWLEHIGLAKDVQAAESRRYGPEYLDVRVKVGASGPSRDITEVGFGVSQALPVVVGALLQPKDSLFLVDLPEAHLHPRAQAEIADLFCALAMSGRRALVETHSEMFFHRLRLRAAMDSELMKAIAVYFVDAPNPDGTCNPPREVGLSFEQELAWPAGFLQEALDSEIQIRSVRQARTEHD